MGKELECQNTGRSAALKTFKEDRSVIAAAEAPSSHFCCCCCCCCCSQPLGSGASLLLHKQLGGIMAQSGLSRCCTATLSGPITDTNTRWSWRGWGMKQKKNESPLLKILKAPCNIFRFLFFHCWPFNRQIFAIINSFFFTAFRFLLLFLVCKTAI